MTRRLILKSSLSPGDILTMTVAIESLHATYPGEFVTDVRTPCPAIWHNNPHLTSIADDDSEAEVIELAYPTIHKSDERPVRFVEAYTLDLGTKLGIPLTATVNRPRLYLSPEELGWINQIREHVTAGRDIPYWLVSAGVKDDYTAKQWPVEYYQEVIERTRTRIQWVQIGEANHNHPALTGVIDMRGKTDLRQFIRLARFAQGGLGPVTSLQHLMAAFEKPYICLLGGREPVQWVSYPLQHTLHTVGLLPCCETRSCWKSRVVPLEDGSDKNNSLCQQPVYGLERPVGRCMALVSPNEVCAILDRWGRHAA